MAEKNEYFTQKLENGTLQISEDVVASVAAAAVLEVEGVCGLSSSISTDIAEMLGVSRNSVTSSISRMQEQGILKKGRSNICVVDMKGLARIANPSATP